MMDTNFFFNLKLKTPEILKIHKAQFELIHRLAKKENKSYDETMNKLSNQGKIVQLHNDFQEKKQHDLIDSAINEYRKLKKQ